MLSSSRPARRRGRGPATSLTPVRIPRRTCVGVEARGRCSGSPPRRTGRPTVAGQRRTLTGFPSPRADSTSEPSHPVTAGVKVISLPARSPGEGAERRTAAARVAGPSQQGVPCRCCPRPSRPSGPSPSGPCDEADARQAQLTKPPGSMGQLEDLGAQLSGIAGTCPPPLPQRPAIAVFAGDHGVHAQGVSPWPQEVTAQMVANLAAGGAVVNALARQVGASVTVVDVGVAADAARRAEPVAAQGRPRHSRPRRGSGHDPGAGPRRARGGHHRRCRTRRRRGRPARHR